MTKPLSYDTALERAIHAVYRGLSINQNPDRNKVCLFTGQIFWDSTIVMIMDEGASLDEAMSVLLDDQEKDEKHRQALQTQWEQDVADIERVYGKEQDNDDDEDDSLRPSRVETWLADFRQKSQDMFSYADDTEGKSS